MEYEDQEEEHEGKIGLAGPSYNDSLVNSNSTRSNKTPCPAEPSPPRKSRYRECLKNYALRIGGYAVDGCGEFIPGGEDGTLESLRCAACNCHRNFHRKETGYGAAGAFAFPQQQLLLTQHHHPHTHVSYRTPSGYLHAAAPQLAQTAELLALPSSSGGGRGSVPSGKKRFRTKFTQEQKDKMLNLAERLGWRIQKQDEEIVQTFCEELGIKRHVLRVWMHNNKHTLGKKT
ncbi:zinc-finger homeodomain protein 2 [Phtheirospermum japonicum]|uniref:Zinc-finger homeodomain protein 2 n=1 Tax=Phtheirospermum japonicum TaxID=374723 RepID=A0A830BYH3_9LAMI|nr:zinc-finger homeodomain protein 2 [Phtheirospermum japonicum]